MKDSAINVSIVTNLNTVQFTMSTEDYCIWRQGEGELIALLSDDVSHGNAVTTITLPRAWFEISKNYCRFGVKNPSS